MAKQVVASEIDGKRYTGWYELVGHGEAQAVSVQFEQDSISAVAGHLSPEIVAKTLLGEVIRAKLAQDEQGLSRRGSGDKTGSSEPLRYRYGQH